MLVEGGSESEEEEAFQLMECQSARFFYRKYSQQGTVYPNNESFEMRLKAHFEYPDLRIMLSSDEA